MSAEQGPQHGQLLGDPEDEEVPARRLLLIRHGHYERTQNLGDTVWGLSPLGRRQAARTGRRLSRLLGHYDGELEGFYASPWPRALQTAEIAAHECGFDRVRIKQYLHESVPLVPVGPDGVTPVHPGLPATTLADRGEVADQVGRVVARFFKGSKKATTTVLFTHGNLIRYLVAGTLRLPFESWGRLDCSHCGITEIRVFGDGFEALVRYNDAGHLPPSMLSAT